MKRVLSVFIFLAMLLPLCCFAEIDLSGMSYDELVALKDQINLAIWNSQEWQEVEVPQGLWIIGKDIPAGKWTITYAEDAVVGAGIVWGDTVDEDGMNISIYGDLYETEAVWHPENIVYQKGLTTEVSWELKDGQFFQVTSGIARFVPYSGKTSLGFKKKSGSFRRRLRLTHESVVHEQYDCKRADQHRRDHQRPFVKRNRSLHAPRLPPYRKRPQIAGRSCAAHIPLPLPVPQC